MNAVTEAPLGSRWYAWGKHYEVVERFMKDGRPHVWLKDIRRKKRDPVSTDLGALLRYGISKDNESSYTEGMNERADQANSPGGATAEAVGSTDSTRKKVNDQMSTTTQEKPAKASAKTGTAKPSGEKLAADLLTAVRKASGSTKLKAEATDTKRSGLTAKKVTNGDANIALLRIYPNRVRVFVRSGGDYNRITVSSNEDIAGAADAMAAKVAAK